MNKLISIILLAVRESVSNTATQFSAAFKRGRLEASLIEKLIFTLAISLLLVTALFPIYIMVITSISSDFVLYNPPPTLIPNPNHLTVEHYQAALKPNNFPFIQYFMNSAIVALSTSVVAVIVATFGGYSFARLEYPGSSAVKMLVLFVYLFSGILLVVPLFRIIIFLGLADTLASLIGTYLVFVLPLSLYMLGNYFEGIPKEIEEAALIDGYSRVETIFRVTLPLSAPGIVAVFLYAFIIAWNEYLFASVFLSSSNSFTLPIGIVNLSLTFQQAWGQVMAASLLTSAPIIIIYLYLEKYMIKGLVAGGVEG